MNKVNIGFTIFMLLFLLCQKVVYAENIKYVVSDISSELINKAEAVIRNSEISYKLLSDDEAQLKVEYAITILKESAIDKSFFIKRYDSYSRIRNIEAAVYDSDGKRVHRIPASEIIDRSAISGFSLYEDSRLKYIDPDYRTVPFTVEYSFTINYSGLLHYPQWIPHYMLNVAIENSTFQIINSTDNKFRFYEQNIEEYASREESPDGKIITWSAKNLHALYEEPLSPPFYEYAPLVLTAPSDFRISGYDGNASSWNNIGEWVMSVNSDRDKLPQETHNQINNLISSAKSTEEKIKLIYTYLQDNSRYVSIQIGIGGWQPFDASTIDRLKYGDCKALTNYMGSLLKIAGIESYYVLVKAGTDAPRVVVDFPSMQFNHAILCVPQETDTIWLECTSQQAPFGYLGRFTDDRKVLAITPQGGKIMHTKTYSISDNRIITKGEVVVDASGHASASTIRTYAGVFYDDKHGVLSSSNEIRKKNLYKQLQIPNFTIGEIEYTECRESIPSVSEKLDLTLNNYCTTIGSRFLLPLNLMSKLESLPAQRDERISEIFIRRETAELDTITFLLPENALIESVPQGQSISNELCSYSTKTEIVNSNEIRYIREFRLYKGTRPKERYSEYYDFVSKIAKLDEARAVIVLKGK